jgi:phosphatidylserine/phosphatidylglycerophosphate/cardiolipin synthase-like enzyme
MSESLATLGIKERKCSILTDHNLAPCILEIIKNSKDYCFLVTPYINLIEYWDHFIRILKEASTDKKRIVFIFKQLDEKDKENNKKTDEKKKVIEELNGEYKFDLFFVKNLHVKMYLNESEVLISSMNLTNFSKDNNYEIGCLINDPDTTQGIVDEIIFGRILKNAEREYKNGISTDWLKERIKGLDTTDS